MSQNLFKLGLASLFICQIAHANSIHLSGTQEQTLTLNNKTVSAQAKPGEERKIITQKTITLPQFTLSEKVRQVISNQLENTMDSATRGDDLNLDVSKSKHDHKQLGMNNVPVLDQGVHGSCVTFAITAAIDAAMKKGDYASQLCLLQLGTYLSAQGEGISGWDGAWGDLTLGRLQQYGFISIANQHKYGCGASKYYPTYYAAPTDGMTVEQYAEHSEQMTDYKVQAEKLFSDEHFTDNTEEPIVNEVKAALDAGKRVAFSVLLPRTDMGTAGAVGWHHYFSDTWVVSYEISQALKHDHDFAGHQMVITGYDDTAVAMDNWGHRHHGLFTLRNSWGRDVADWGDFYMSYDYFKALAMDSHVIYVDDK